MGPCPKRSSSILIICALSPGAARRSRNSSRGPLGVTFEWRHFSLYQNNYHSHSSNGWQLWNDRLSPDDEAGGKGLLPFLASCAARKQGTEKHDRFRLELMRARYKHHQPYTLATIREVAKGACLHLPTFESDLWDPECRTRLAHEHYRAEALDVFGTPTFGFENGHLAYFRINDLPGSKQEAVELFADYRRLLECYPYLETVKRPRPKGN